MVERGVLVLVALAVGVAAVVWVHPARLESQAQKLAERPPSALSERDVDRAIRLFESAQVNNPGERPVEREAGLLIRSGRTRAAIAQLRALVEREPKNVTAWALLAIGAQRADPALARAAAARVRVLNPLGAQAR